MIGWEGDRMFYVFAIYMGHSVYLKNKLYQATVALTPTGYRVTAKGTRLVETYYSSKESMLNDWDVIYFTGKKKEE